jgi:hypothetical protein
MIDKSSTRLACISVLSTVLGNNFKFDESTFAQAYSVLAFDEAQAKLGK